MPTQKANKGKTWIQRRLELHRKKNLPQSLRLYIKSIIKLSEIPIIMNNWLWKIISNLRYDQCTRITLIEKL